MSLLIAQTLATLAANTVVWYSVTIGVYLAAMGLGALLHDRSSAGRPVGQVVQGGSSSLCVGWCARRARSAVQPYVRAAVRPGRCSAVATDVTFFGTGVRADSRHRQS
ncbi:MAG: hypothetical protein U5R48_18865 [Gammaproteobacteria bacterium]|nr:hypothetical protein [Gammaproteobacteria bacterium]